MFKGLTLRCAHAPVLTRPLRATGRPAVLRHVAVSERALHEVVPHLAVDDEPLDGAVESGRDARVAVYGMFVVDSAHKQRLLEVEFAEGALGLRLDHRSKRERVSA